MKRTPPIKTWLPIKDPGEFRTTLLEVIDDTFDEILGETATQIIYSHLEQKHQLKREDIPDHLWEFLLGLERIFGVGALIVEKAIMENLYSRLRSQHKNICLEYTDKEQFNLITYIADLRAQT